ncbi:MAG: phospholipase A [Vibrio sp.]
MRANKVRFFLFNACCLPLSFVGNAWADLPSAYDLCLLDKIKTLSGNQTIDSVREQCKLNNVVKIEPATSAAAVSQSATKSAEQSTSIASQKSVSQTEMVSSKAQATSQIQTTQASSDSLPEQDTTQPFDEKASLAEKRIAKERETAFEPFTMTPHRLNYILPISYMDTVNDVYDEKSDWGDNLEKAESEFQISFKVPLNYADLMIDGDALYFGMTLHSFWQVYAADISRPFRETNYRPEVFYVAPTEWTPFDGSTALGVGIEHQSNGRSQGLSRSWNRVYAQFYYAKDSFAMKFQPWWRIPEDEKDDPMDAKGDDNPDIDDYMGHFELSAAYKWNELEFMFLGRENFATHKGYGEFGLTFPIWGKLRGYTKYSTGYGSSLIDYDKNENRIGIGVALGGVL